MDASDWKGESPTDSVQRRSALSKLVDDLISVAKRRRKLLLAFYLTVVLGLGALYSTIRTSTQSSLENAIKIQSNRVTSVFHGVPLDLTRRWWGGFDKRKTEADCNVD